MHVYFYSNGLKIDASDSYLDDLALTVNQFDRDWIFSQSLCFLSLFSFDKALHQPSGSLIISDKLRAIEILNAILYEKASI